MWARLLRPASEAHAAGLALRLTCVEMLLRPMGPWGVRPFLLAGALLALVSTRVLEAPLTWLVLAALVGARVVADWPLPDNHVYLLGYWALAAALATWGTLALEAAIAALSLAPLPGRVAEGLRHAALLAFCLTTYALAPVAGFGWILVALGAAQCRPESQRLRAAYVATYALVL